MSFNALSPYMTDLLTEQTKMIMRAITELDAIRGELPQHRQPEVDAIIQRLQEAVNQDREALKRMAGLAEPSQAPN